MNQYPHSIFNNLTDGGTIRKQIGFYRDDRLPPEYRQQKYRELQEEFAVGLYDAIQHCRHPVVVELFEEIKHQDIDIITLDARLTPTETHRYIFSSVTYQDHLSPKQFHRYKYHKTLDKILDFFKVK